MSSVQPTPLRPVTAETPSTLRRVQPIERAARLIAEDRVRLIAGAKVYEVTGDHDVYRVIADQDGIVCPCDARTSLCAHVIAVALIRQRGKPAPERLAADLGVKA